MCACLCLCPDLCMCLCVLMIYGVATISRLLYRSLLQNIVCFMFYRALLQKRPIIWRRLLIVGTPRRMAHTPYTLFTHTAYTLFTRHAIWRYGAYNLFAIMHIYEYMFSNVHVRVYIECIRVSIYTRYCNTHLSTYTRYCNTHVLAFPTTRLRTLNIFVHTHIPRHKSMHVL